MKKKIMIVLMIGVLLFLMYFFGTGFMKNGSTYIDQCTISESGTEMTIRVGVSSSAGYIRKVQVHQQQGSRLYLDCYNAFGGINGPIGAKDVYTIPLNGDTEVIALYRNTNCYEEVLRKDNNGQWQKIR